MSRRSVEGKPESLSESRRDNQGRRRYHSTPMAGAFLATVLFSISAICGNRASKLLGGTEANFWRLAFAALLLAIYAHWIGGGISGSAFKTFFISGCIGFGIGDLALFQALPRIGSRLSVMLVLCLSSPIGAALEWWWMKTALTVPQIISALITLLGVAVALAPGAKAPIPPGVASEQ
ncbi:MAG TPA: DMT family transporter, partial [Verrucomicrobiae bacterium]|nr:DMT family transporter [Verrucomicrobiae bacterium]